MKKIDVGGAAPLLAVGGDHLVLVPEVLVEVPRLEPGVRRQPQILDPVIGGVFSVSLGHFWGAGGLGAGSFAPWLESPLHGTTRRGTFQLQTPQIQNGARRKSSDDRREEARR